MRVVGAWLVSGWGAMNAVPWPPIQTASCLSHAQLSTHTCLPATCLQVQAGQYGRSAAVKVHSALQEHLTTQRSKAGKPSFALRFAAPYNSLYDVWCTKKRDRVLGEAADDECEYRAAVVHTSFGRDPYVQGAHAMLASPEPLQAKLLSMYLGQVQMVARGDDLRGRKLKDLGTRNLACVGECASALVSVAHHQNS